MSPFSVSSSSAGGHVGVVHRQPTQVYHAIERPDASDAITDAFQMSEKYGTTSKEARIAWDVVEEMYVERYHIVAFMRLHLS